MQNTHLQQLQQVANSRRIFQAISSPLATACHCCILAKRGSNVHEQRRGQLSGPRSSTFVSLFPSNNPISYCSTPCLYFHCLEKAKGQCDHEEWQRFSAFCFPPTANRHITPPQMHQKHKNSSGTRTCPCPPHQIENDVPAVIPMKSVSVNDEK